MQKIKIKIQHHVNRLTRILVCSVEHIPGPPAFFIKFIAFHLSIIKKGEVITKMNISKGHYS